MFLSFDQFLVDHNISIDTHKQWCQLRDRSIRAGEKVEPLLVWVERMSRPAHTESGKKVHAEIETPKLVEKPLRVKRPWVRRIRAAEPPRPLKTKCDYCGADMRAQRSTTLYCSVVCNKRSYEARSSGRPYPATLKYLEKVVTPDGMFDSVREAAHHHGIKQNAARQRLTRGTKGWRYVDVMA